MHVKAYHEANSKPKTGSSLAEKMSKYQCIKNWLETVSRIDSQHSVSCLKTLLDSIRSLPLVLFTLLKAPFVKAMAEEAQTAEQISLNIALHV